MKLIKRFLLLVVVLLVLVVAAVVVVVNPFGASPLNDYPRDGVLSLPGLTEPVTVYRDENGMAYIYAKNRDDLFLAQGFVTAQDRLFQMELTRLFASGRIGELAGEKARELDVRMRTLGFRRHATEHIGLLNEETRRFLQKYADGVNAFLARQPESVHLEFKLAGITPGSWAPVDTMTILYYMGWGSAANIQDEIVAQMLLEKLGPEKARELFPISINPAAEEANLDMEVPSASFKGLLSDPATLGLLSDRPLAIGSNNWAVGPERSQSGKPILAGDPHLDARILPGVWYPVGLISPDLRAIGVMIPGAPFMAIGRTDRFAVSITNDYVDCQDLYVETVGPVDPGHYLEGGRSLPFQTIEETLKFKDKSAQGGFREEKFIIRLTGRGPVVSGVMPGLETAKVLTMRWSAFEAKGPSLGFEKMLDARNVHEVRAALADANQIALNFVFADVDGNIGWQTTGRAPIRSQGESIVPYEVTDGQDNWTGFIPFEEMPHAINPEEGWLGTTNHKTIGPDFPYYLSSHYSPSYRQRRLMEIMAAPGKTTAADHWGWQRDPYNKMAERIAPVMTEALAGSPATSGLAEILRKWDFRDVPGQPASTIFQAVYREFALLTYRDDLGDELVRTMLGEWYFWQESLQAMVLEGDSPWFDDRTTDKIETRDDLFRLAAVKAVESLKPTLGEDPEQWDWGKVHLHEFVSPIRRSGPGTELLGGGSHPAPGSGETLCRGIYDFNNPYKVTVSASMRMVADLGDPDKIMAVLPGGVTGRQFHPNFTDQLEPFMYGGERNWYFSDGAIKAHAQNTLELLPEK